MNLSIKKLERGENEWLKETHFLGIAEPDDSITLYLEEGYDHSIVSLSWVILHEFRHVIQHKRSALYTCIYNSNLALWKSMYADENAFEHVLHEIHPREIDANIFACELLDVPYPSSKFEMTEKTIKMLEESNISHKCFIPNIIKM